MPKRTTLDPALLQAALEGLQMRLTQVNDSIAAVKSMMGGRAPKAAEKPAPKPRRVLSAAARKRISEAQRKRWAQIRAKSAKARTPKKAAKSAQAAQSA